MAGPDATFEESMCNQDDDKTKEATRKPEDDKISHAAMKQISSKLYQENVKSVHVKFRDFVCDTCPNSFGKNSHLRRHQERVHSTARKYTCLVCSKGCVSKGDLVTHMKCHTGERSFICETCSLTFTTNSILKAHKRKHDGTMFQCQSCDKEFSTSSNLKVHVNYVHLKVSTRMKSQRRRELRRLRAVQQKLMTSEALDMNDSKFIPKSVLKEKFVFPKLEKKKEQSLEMCTICGKFFKKMSKKKIHMLTHSKMYKNLSIVNNVIWSEDKAKMSCMDCGKEFQGAFKANHMKAHIAQVHYQLQNIENLDSVDIFDIAKRIENNSLKYLTENLPNLSVRRSENQIVVKHSEEFINFLTELNSEFPGPQLVLVLSFVQDLKENNNTGPLEKIIKEGKNGNYRKIFEDIGVLQTNSSIKSESFKQSPPKKVMFKEDKVKKDLVASEMAKKEKVSQEKVKIEPYPENISMDLKSTNTENILIDGLAASLTTIVEDRSQYDAQELYKETSYKPKQKRTQFTEKHSLKKKVAAKKLEKTNMCQICGRTFRKISKQKIHMMTHTQVFKNLSIDNNIIWSEDGTKVSCMDCGREFQGRDKNGHMKTHIALVHYQMHNLDNLDTFNLLDTYKSVQTLDIKKSACQPIKSEENFLGKTLN